MAILEGLFALYGVINGAAGLVEAKNEIEAKAAIDQARAHIESLQAQARSERDQAKREGDRVAQTAAEATLAKLAALERRTNLRRLGRQSALEHERWRKDKRDGYVANSIGGRIFGWVGGHFGGAQKTAIAEGGKMGFAKSVDSGAQGIEVNTEALLASILDDTEDIRPLPEELGAYLARESYRRVLKDNPQLAGEDRDEVFAFMCSQARKDLERLMRSVMTNEQVEAIRAANDELCKQQYASGTLDAQGDLREAHSLMTQRQVRLHYTQGGEVTGTFEVKIEANDRRLAEFAEGIGEAAGGAAAGGLDWGSAKKKKPKGPTKIPKEIKGCKLTGTFMFALEGTHDGDTSMSGTATQPAGNGFTLECPGKSKKIPATEVIKGKLSWSAKDRGADISVTISLGELRFKGDVPSGREPSTSP